MKLTVKDIKGNAQGEVEFDFPPVDAGKGNQAVHDVVVAYQAAQRSGTACTKNVGDVNGTNKKPWRQKGTGRARAGSFASPLWRGGGVVFGPKPRSYRKTVTKSTRYLALRKALGERLKTGDVIVVDDFKLETPKTKGFLSFLLALEIDGTALIVSGEPNKNLSLASRNVPLVQLTTATDLNTYEVVRYDKLIFTRTALEKLQERLKND